MKLISMNPLRFWSNICMAAAFGAALQDSKLHINLMFLVAVFTGIGIIFDYYSIKKGFHDI